MKMLRSKLKSKTYRSARLSVRYRSLRGYRPRLTSGYAVRASPSPKPALLQASHTRKTLGDIALSGEDA